MDTQSYLALDALKDGTAVTVRAIRPGDGAAVRAAWKGLDRESIYTRFFSYRKEPTDSELRTVVDVDPDHVVALIVTTTEQDGEKLIGSGRYVSAEPLGVSRNAEVAFIVSDDYRGRGTASLLLRHLVRIGRSQGLSRFDADVLGHNRAMLEVFRRSGLPIKQQLEDGAVHVSMELERDN